MYRWQCLLPIQQYSKDYLKWRGLPAGNLCDVLEVEAPTGDLQIGAVQTAILIEQQGTLCKSPMTVPEIKRAGETLQVGDRCGNCERFEAVIGAAVPIFGCPLCGSERTSQPNLSREEQDGIAQLANILAGSDAVTVLEQGNQRFLTAVELRLMLPI